MLAMPVLMVESMSTASAQKALHNIDLLINLVLVNMTKCLHRSGNYDVESFLVKRISTCIPFPGLVSLGDGKGVCLR